MLFYGDGARTEDARAKLAAVARALRGAEAMPAGVARHGALAAAFIEAGELAQGVADAEFEARYAAAFTHAMMRVEEAEADLRSIRMAQAKMGLGLGGGVPVGVGVVDDRPMEGVLPSL